MNQWQAAYGWGDHATQNYIKNIAPLHVDIPNLRVGIGIVAPAEKLDVDSIIQITAPDANTRASLYFRHISTGGHDLASITSLTSGTNGGDLQFWTTDNGSRTQKITINEKGAIGIGATTPNYGTPGQLLKTNGSGSAVSWDTNTYLTQANIYDLNGLTWSNVNNNELIRRVDATNADGAGMTLHDTSSPTSPQTTYYKDVSYFGRHGLLTIPFGVNRFESSFVGYNQRLIPYAPILLSTTLVSGLYLHHLPSINDYNVRVGVNVNYPSQDFQVGTTLYVDDTNKRVGINQASPSVDLEVLNTMYVDSNTRKVGIVNATPTTTFQVGTTLYVNDTTGQVGINKVTPDEELDINGTLRIEANGTQTIRFYDTGGGQTKEHARIEATDNGGGADMLFYTRPSGGNEPTEKFKIDKDGGIYAGNTTSNTTSSFTRVLVKMVQSIFKFYDIAENILATISSVADGAGGKLRFYTTNATSGLEVINLTIKESGAFGLGNTEDCGLAGQVLTSNNAGSAVSWTTPTAPPPGAYGVFYVNGLLTVPANTGQQVNKLVQDTRFPLTNIALGAFQSSGNTAQTITVLSLIHI